MKETPNLCEALSHVVKATRKERNITQIELAKRMGCARSFVTYIEAGYLQLSVNAFLCMAKAFEIEPEELLKRLKSALLVLNNRHEETPPHEPEPQKGRPSRVPIRKMRPF